jgi:hypothetical protein
MAIGLGETGIRDRRIDFARADYSTRRPHSAVGYRPPVASGCSTARDLDFGRRQCNINFLTPPGTKIGPLIPGSGDWMDEGLRR